MEELEKMAHLPREKAIRLMQLLNQLEVKYGKPLTYWEIGPEGLDIPDEQVEKIKSKMKDFAIFALLGSVAHSREEEKEEGTLDVLESVATAPFRFLKSLF